MKQITLKEVLMTQDMGEKGVNRICDNLLLPGIDGINGLCQSDPVSGIIANAFINNGYLFSEDDRQSAMTDLEYAINQLVKARNAINHSL